MIDAKSVKERLGLSAKDIIMAGYGLYENKGGKVSCPYHTDSDPSMKWYDESLSFHCYACDQGNNLDIFQYYQDNEGMTFSQAVNTVAEMVGEVIDRSSTPKKVYAQAKEQFNQLSQKAIEIAKKRGITKQTLEYWGVKSSSEYFSSVAENRECFVFQYKDDKGKTVFNTFRSLEGKHCARQKDTKEILWGMDKVNLKSNDPVIICEGQFDAMVISQCGYKNVVSVPSGIKANEWIENCWSWLNKVKRFVIWSDNDEAGIKGAAEIRNRLGKEKTELDCSPDFKDANDMLLLDGEDAVKDFIAYLTDDTADGLVNMGRRIDRKKDDETFYSGFTEIDAHIKKFTFGHVTVIFGRDNEGKSTFVSQLIGNVLDKEKVFLFSGELTDSKVEEWIMSQLIGRAPNYVSKSIDEWGDEEIKINPMAKRAIKKWYCDRFYMYESKMELDNQNNIFNVMEMAYKKHGIRVFVLDNLFSAIDDSDRNENSKETNFVKRCKLFALTYKVKIFIVAHPNKESSNEHTPLSKTSVSGSKNITNSADNVIAVERVWKKIDDLDKDVSEIYKHVEDGKHHTTVVRILKCRNPKGRLDIFFRFDVQTLRFFNKKTPSNPTRHWEKYYQEEATLPKISRS